MADIIQDNNNLIFPIWQTVSAKLSWSHYIIEGSIAITLLHQLDYLLYCVIERAKNEFLAKGGIKEEMYRARIAARGAYHNNQSNQSYRRDGVNNYGSSHPSHNS